MARPLRVEYAGAIYHVSDRMLGDWKREHNLLFEDDADRLRFLEQLGKRVDTFEIRLYLFTLMANHYHLVLETPLANLAAFMQSLSTAYAVYFNLRHGRHGHLFDGRYGAKLVEGDGHLLALTRYVHLNPVFTGAMLQQPLEERIRFLERYRWSSYPGYIGARRQYEIVDSAPVLAQMGGPACGRAKRYRQYVESALAECDEDFLTVMNSSPLCIGGDDFRKSAELQYESKYHDLGQPRDALYRKVLGRVDPERVLAVLAEVFGVTVEEFRQRRRNSLLRGVAARMLRRFSGLSQRQAAAVLGMREGSSISWHETALLKRLRKDQALGQRLSAAEVMLKQLRGP